MNILRLKELLGEKNMSGKDLADKVGVTPASISNIVQGNSFPKPDLLVKIAEQLDVDIKEMFYSTKEKNVEIIYALRDGKYVEVGALNNAAV